MSAADLVDVRLTTRAVDSFRFHHGGGIEEAETQLRAILEDFVLMSARTRTESGFLKLSREGFTLLLSPDLDAITGYSTVHRERTWEQVKAGVPSRIRHKTRMSPWIDESTPIPSVGPAIPLERLIESFDADTVFLTPRVRRSFVKLESLPNTGRDSALDLRIRAALSELVNGTLTQRDDGAFEVTHDGRAWLISGDARVVIGVKRA